MKKFVVESLDEMFEAKDAKSIHSNIEQTKPKKISQDKQTKIKQAIDALETEKKRAQKPGGMKQTLIQKKSDIAAIQKKIDAWKAKLADLKECANKK